MSTDSYYLSFCIPVHNEGETVLSNLTKIRKGLTKLLKSKKYEILIIENGSSGNALRELAKIKLKDVRVISLRKKGHGLALRTSILKAKAEFVLLTAIDLPFGFSDLEKMLKLANDNHIIFGSKAHPQSVIYSPKIRRITSKIYRMLLRLFFKIKVKDTQGTVFLRRAAILPLLGECDCDNAFFSAQLAIFAERKGLKITEVPVVMDRINVRKSKYNVLSNGSEMFLSMLRTFLRLNLSPKS